MYYLIKNIIEWKWNGIELKEREEEKKLQQKNQ